MNSELSSRSNIRSLRQLHKIDYKKMNDGEDQTLRSSDKKPTEILNDVGVGSFDENPLGASGTSSGSSEPVRGQVLDPLFDDFDRDQDEAEIQEMQLQMKRLSAIEARLERKKRLEQMKKELDDQKRRVREMKGKNPPPTKTSDSEVKIHSQAKTSDKGARPKTIEAISKLKVPASTTDVDIKPDSDSEQVTIESLRQNPKLQKQVKKELSKLGLKVISLKDESSSSESESSETTSSSDSESSKKKKKKHKSKKNKADTESSDSSSSDDSDASKKKKKKHKSKKHKKSGINAKSSDKVKDPQRWPHAYLQYEFVNKQVKFDELDFKLFLAGEISIIAADDLSESERKGRLDLLKKIIYYSNTYEFKGLKAFYVAWLREIELKKKSWSDDPQQIETAILSKYLLKNKGFSSIYKKDSSNKTDSNDDKTWFCSDYQRNKCKHRSSHLKVHNGKQKLASHICASCWLKDKKKLEHPECSSSCPHLGD